MKADIPAQIWSEFGAANFEAAPFVTPPPSKRDSRALPHHLPAIATTSAELSLPIEQLTQCRRRSAGLKAMTVLAISINGALATSSSRGRVSLKLPSRRKSIAGALRCAIEGSGLGSSACPRSTTANYCIATGEASACRQAANSG